MKKKAISGYVIMGMSLFVALMLTIIPFPRWANWLRPEWVLLVMLYWILTEHCKVGVGIAWIIGVILDLLLGSILGAHALTMMLVVFLTTKLHAKMRLLTLSHKTIAVFVIIFLYKLVLFLLQGLLGVIPITCLYWVPVFSSLLFWPWIFLLLNDFCHRFKLID